MISEETRVYRQCFSSVAGKTVLANILADWGFFDDNVNSPEEVAKANCARTILKKCGIINVETIGSFVDKLFEIPVDMEKK